MKMFRKETPMHAVETTQNPGIELFVKVIGVYSLLTPMSFGWMVGVCWLFSRLDSRSVGRLVRHNFIQKS